jgi:multicomponent Na+:H+ antiporter subunit F
MNALLAAAIAMLICLAPAVWVAAQAREHLEAVVALQLTGSVVTMVLLLLAEGMNRSALYDPAVVLAMLSLGSGLVFARSLERWL